MKVTKHMWNKTTPYIDAVRKKFNLINTIRPFQVFVSKHFSSGRDLIGVEIGVALGKNAFNLLNNLKNIKELYLVDPYSFYDGWHGEGERNAYEIAAREKVSCFDNAIFVKKLSSDAVSDIPDELDFIYIDGNHDYEFVKKDIELYYPKVKVGGVMGGHDFCVEHPGVVRAVIDFAEKHNLKLMGKEKDWWFIIK